ncbi:MULTISPECIES: STAS domain-containing protein [unclassified Janibacter]|uniref:STAS domain-containing protein n=1 Tax=unclassified Janibacter TaxID=2649294 RepID=UPI003CFEE934
MAVNLSVTSADHDGVTVVAAEGEIDVYTAQILRDALDRHISAGQHTIVADLERVTFLDSTGLGVLVGRLKLLRNHSGWLHLVATQDRILRVFSITGLDRVFPIHATREDAIDAAKADDPRESSAS